MTQVKDFTRQHRGLLALNTLLILALLVVTFAPASHAQQRPARPRGEYTMVPASALGFSEDALWIVDASNREVVAMRYDRSLKQLRFLGFRDLALDAEAASRRGR